MVGFLNLRWIPDVPLKPLLPFLRSWISKEGLWGGLRLQAEGICVCAHVDVLRNPVDMKACLAWHLSNMNFWGAFHPMQPALTSCCFCAAARGSWHGRSWRNNAAFPLLPIVHRSLHCSVPPRPLRHSHPASWHGDGSAVDRVHNAPSSPRHNRGTWTQAPLWHTRGWGGETGASQAGGAANVSVTCW